MGRGVSYAVATLLLASFLGLACSSGERSDGSEHAGLGVTQGDTVASRDRISDRTWRLPAVTDVDLAARARQIAEHATKLAATNPALAHVLSPRADGLLAEGELGELLKSAAFRLPAEERMNA